MEIQFPIPRSTRPKRLRHAVIASWMLLIFGAVLDTATTIYALETMSGVEETNPLANSFYMSLGPWGLTGLKTALVAVTIGACYVMWRFGSRAYWTFFPGIPGSLWSFAGSANLTLILTETA